MNKLLTSPVLALGLTLAVSACQPMQDDVSQEGWQESGQAAALRQAEHVGSMADESYSQPRLSASASPQSKMAMGYAQTRSMAPQIAPVPSSNRYETRFEEGYLDPQLSPLSTFALDVDTASYSNLRRYINAGRLPPTDAVRIEELLNYFDYQTTVSDDGQSVSIYSELGVAPWDKSKQLALVQLSAKELSANENRPNRLVFLIDTSGSMQGPDRLPLLKKAFQGLVENLGKNDRVAIVTYAGSAGVALPSVNGGEKDKIYQALQSLRPAGSTAGAAGIEQAYQIARSQFDDDANNRVILATDGDFNVGQRSSTDLVKLIETQRDMGIFLTILGFGQGNLGDGPMNRMAQHGDGNYYYIDSELEARRVLVDKLQRSLVTVAKDVKLQVEFNPAQVAKYRLLGYETRRMAAEDFKDDKKDAGELGAGQVVTAIYEIEPRYTTNKNDIELRYQQRQGKTSNRDELMLIKLRYRSPAGGPAKEIAQALNTHQSKASSRNFQWAAAVAEFGLLMSDSDYRGNASFTSLVSRTESLAQQGNNIEREFVSLARLASLIKNKTKIEQNQDASMKHDLSMNGAYR